MRRSLATSYARASRRALRALRALRSVAHVVAALVVLAAVVQAGNRWVYCAVMGQVLDTPCCSNETHPRELDQVRQASDCCRTFTVAQVPTATAADAATPSTPAAPQVAMLPAIPRLDRMAAPVQSRNTHHTCDPPPSRASDSCAELMVFLI